jgi:hypothetical protein
MEGEEERDGRVGGEWRGSGMGGEGGGVGWEERGLEPNGTATEHREGGGPFGSKSLYIYHLLVFCVLYAEPQCILQAQVLGTAVAVHLCSPSYVALQCSKC